MGYFEKILAETSYTASLTYAVRKHVKAQVSATYNADTDTVSVKIDNGITNVYYYTIYNVSRKFLYGYNHKEDAMKIAIQYRKFIARIFFKI